MMNIYVGGRETCRFGPFWWIWFRDQPAKVLNSDTVIPSPSHLGETILSF